MYRAAAFPQTYLGFMRVQCHTDTVTSFRFLGVSIVACLLLVSNAHAQSLDIQSCLQSLGVKPGVVPTVDQIRACTSKSSVSSTSTPKTQAQHTVADSKLTSTACPWNTRTLMRGSRGTSVNELQAFLITKGYLSSDSATGYFGSLTEAAVQKFQCNQSIVCSGNPSSTGYGLVGAKTRAAIQRLCGGTTTTTTTNTVTHSPQSLIDQLSAQIKDLQSRITGITSTRATNAHIQSTNNSVGTSSQNTSNTAAQSPSNSQPGTGGTTNTISAHQNTSSLEPNLVADILDRYRTFASSLGTNLASNPYDNNYILAAYYLLARSHLLHADTRGKLLTTTERAQLIDQIVEHVVYLENAEMAYNSCAQKLRTSISNYFPTLSVRGWTFYGGSGSAAERSACTVNNPTSGSAGDYNVAFQIFGSDTGQVLYALTEAALALREAGVEPTMADRATELAEDVMADWYGTRFTSFSLSGESILWPGWYYEEFTGGTVNGIAHTRTGWVVNSNAALAAAALNLARLQAGSNWGSYGYAAAQVATIFKNEMVWSDSGGAYVWHFANEATPPTERSSWEYVEDLTHSGLSMHFFTNAYRYSSTYPGMPIYQSDIFALVKTLENNLAPAAGGTFKKWIDGATHRGETWISGSSENAELNRYAGEWAVLGLALKVDDAARAAEYVKNLETHIFDPVRANLSNHYGYYHFLFDAIALDVLVR